MLISEIFKSISGEAAQAGYPAIFIRAFGCPLRCRYCDSLYSVEGQDYDVMSVDEIVKIVDDLDCRRVVFTGGEPLIQKDAFELVTKLVEHDHTVEIETSGAVRFKEYLCLPNVTITMDWKSISSGMSDKMIGENLYDLREQDVLKFVVSSKEDMDAMVRVAAETKAQCFVSPIFGDIEPKDIVQYLLENHLNDIRFQLQIHKYVWSRDARGV